VSRLWPKADLWPRPWPAIDMCPIRQRTDLFRHRDQENKRWTFDEYLAKWNSFRRAFHKKLPQVAVAGPDTASDQMWVKQFLQDVPKEEVVMATSHYYPLGPPTDPSMTIDMLLHPGTRFESSCREAIEFAKAAGLPFRMTEGNSCYNAGKQGVSDTFASALWRQTIACKWRLWLRGSQSARRANGYYSPIVGSIESGFTARPEYYGLMLAQQFAGLTLHRTTLERRSKCTAYASAGTAIRADSHHEQR